MAGFPLYTDADVHGPIVDALKRRGWDVLRAIDAYPKGTDDKVHFSRAIEERRVLVATDLDQLLAAQERVAAGAWFPGLIHWKREHERWMSVGEFVDAFEAMAVEPEPFANSRIRYIKPRR